MMTMGVVIASFMIVPESTGTQIIIGVGAIFLFGLVLGLFNASLVGGVKAPSIIAALATLSILEGIALALRETPGGIIDREFTAALRTSIGPVPIAFIAVVVGAGFLDLAPRQWLRSPVARRRV